MIQNGPELTATVFGKEIKELNYGIEDAQMGFILEVLRSKMYSNPIRAICREISANSRDANREAGRGNEPITIKITLGDGFYNNTETCVTFKDHGLGISPDRMADVFCKYGSSTKNSSNYYTGGFGLGAKTPFAYSDTFSIITIVDGLKYYYVTYIDPTRKGKIILHKTEATIEPSGTEIIIPVRSQDVSTFHYEIFNAVEFWDAKPNDIGFTCLQRYLPVRKYSDNFSVVINEPLFKSQADAQILAVIDGFPYNVKRQEVNDQTFFLKGFTQIFFFETGQLTISANREELQYDEKTKTLLNERCQIAFEVFKTQVQSHISLATNRLEAIIRISELDTKNLDHSEPAVRFINLLADHFGKTNHDFFWDKKLLPKTEFKLKYHSAWEIQKELGMLDGDISIKQNRQEKIFFSRARENAAYLYANIKEKTNREYNHQIIEKTKSSFILVKPYPKPKELKIGGWKVGQDIHITYSESEAVQYLEDQEQELKTLLQLYPEIKSYSAERINYNSTTIALPKITAKTEVVTFKIGVVPFGRNTTMKRYYDNEDYLYNTPGSKIWERKIIKYNRNLNILLNNFTPSNSFVTIVPSLYTKNNPTSRDMKDAIVMASLHNMNLLAIPKVFKKYFKDFKQIEEVIANNTQLFKQVGEAKNIIQDQGLLKNLEGLNFPSSITIKLIKCKEDLKQLLLINNLSQDLIEYCFQKYGLPTTSQGISVMEEILKTFPLLDHFLSEDRHITPNTKQELNLYIKAKAIEDNV